MSECVYFLWDPRNGDIRYIGKTAYPEWRLKCHQKKRYGKTYCAHWKQEMARAGVYCEMAILEKGLTPERANERERWWIAYGREQRWPLTNGIDGGDGLFNPSLEVRKRLSAANKGRKRSAEAVEKSRKGVLGMKRSLETRERIRQGALRQWARYRGEIP